MNIVENVFRIIIINVKIAEERGVGSEEYESVMNNNLHGQTAVVASKKDTLFTPKYH